jgi:hypothetical protein
LGEAFLQYPFLGTISHQFPIYQYVKLAMADESLNLSLVGGYISAGKVLDELFPPIINRWRYCQYQLLGGGEHLELAFLP